MTKLMEWLLLLGIFTATYIALLTKQIKYQFLNDNEWIIMYSPIYLGGLFAVSIDWLNNLSNSP